MQKIYTPKQAAAILGITERTMQTYLRDGRIKGFKIGGTGAWRITDADLSAFCENSKTMPQREYSKKSPVVLQHKLHELARMTCPFDFASTDSAKWVYRFFTRFYILWREEALKQNIPFAETQKNSPKYVQAGFTALEQLQAETDEERQARLLEQVEEDKPFQIALEEWGKAHPNATGRDAVQYEAEYRKAQYEQERERLHGHDAERKSKA